MNTKFNLDDQQVQDIKDEIINKLPEELQVMFTLDNTIDNLLKNIKFEIKIK